MKTLFINPLGLQKRLLNGVGANCYVRTYRLAGDNEYRLIGAYDDKIESQATEIEQLRGALENIRDHAISNGEDCAYLDARAALKETE